MGTYSDVEVSAYIKISAEARIHYDVFDDEQIEFSIGGRRGIELVTSAEGLPNLLVHLEQALHAARRLGDSP